MYLVFAIVALVVIGAAFWVNAGSSFEANDRTKFAVAGLVLLGLIVGFLFLPVVQAANKYEAAADDYSVSCEAAIEGADAWAKLGFASMYEQWKRTAAGDCILAESRRRRELGY